MFFDSSEEGSEKGLSWVRGKVVRFEEKKFAAKLTVPNMGWLDVAQIKTSKVMDGLEGARFYFAHSYHVVTEDHSVDLLSANYGYSFTAAVGHENLVGVQFHPEKSHRFGMRLLQNFAENFS
jgi:imidazole glycerol-phosphate synthase subunit HisH